MTPRQRWACAAMAALSLAGCSRGPDAEFVTSAPWALTGSRVVLDSHTHTRFSDGALRPAELASKAAEGGCTALAITDHGDPSVAAATPAYFDEIDAVRARHAGMIVFAGLEWNVPPYLGREHVTLLVEPALERTLLPEFKARFEPKDASAGDALRWLAGQAGRAERIALIYNHPSRRDLDPEENQRDYAAWRDVNDLFVGFEGGPGHQKVDPPGDYRGRIRTKDRWDPVVAEIGGAWDRLLDAGEMPWGALAVSDYHGDKDHVPCVFARTHLRVPQVDHRGVLQALRAGTFWAGHGRVLDDLAFVAVHPALEVPAAAGETFRLGASAPMPVFRVAVKRSAGGAGLPLVAEIIGNGSTGRPESIAQGEIAPDREHFDWAPKSLVAGQDGKSAYFRARVTARDASGGALVAYSNPIRIIVGR